MAEYRKTRLRTEIFHSIEEVVRYINDEQEESDLIAADYALNACEENGYGYSQEEANAHLEILEEEGALFNKKEALLIFSQGVAFLESEV